MVCVPCIVIPFLLWVFHKFIRPFLLKIYDPWGKTEKIEGDTGGGTENSTEKVANGTANGLSCPFSGKKTEEVVQGDKKND